MRFSKSQSCMSITQNPVDVFDGCFHCFFGFMIVQDEKTFLIIIFGLGLFSKIIPILS